MTGFTKYIFLLLDGIPYDVFSKLISENKLPNIKKHIIDRGCLKRAASVFPSTTGPAFIPFIAGLFPGTANIPGIRWLSKKCYLKDSRFRSPGICSYMGLDGLKINEHLESGPTIFEYFKKPNNIYNLLTKGCKREFDISKKTKSRDYLHAFFSKNFTLLDSKSTKYLLQAVDNNSDCIICLYPGIDEYAHFTSRTSELVISEYKKVDEAIGRLFDKLIKKNIYDETLVVLSSDHGISDTHTHIDVVKYLDKNGFKCLHFPKLLRTNVKCASMVSGNGMINLYLKNNSDGWGNRADYDQLKNSGIIEVLLNMKGIDFIACTSSAGSGPGSVNISGVTVENSKGKGYITENNGKISYSFEGEDPLTYNRSFKNITYDEALELTFDTMFPDALVQLLQIFRSERTGDLIISAARGYDLRARYEVHEHHATHGALTSEQINVPFAANVKIKENFIRTVDIFPTVLNILGHKIEHRIDGRQLTVDN